MVTSSLAADFKGLLRSRGLSNPTTPADRAAVKMATADILRLHKATAEDLRHSLEMSDLGDRITKVEHCAQEIVTQLAQLVSIAQALVKVVK